MAKIVFQFAFETILETLEEKLMRPDKKAVRIKTICGILDSFIDGYITARETIISIAKA